MARTKVALPTASTAPDSRTRLLDAALQVIRAKGYSATRVDDICEAAGLSKGSFFHHFASKEELAVAAAAHWSATTGALFQSAPYHAHPDPLDRVLGYIDFRRSILRRAVPEFTCLVGTMVQEAYESNPAIRDACERSIFGHADEVAKDIALAKSRYAPDAKWTTESLAYHTQAVLQGAFVLAKARNSSAVAEECVDHLRRYLEQLFHHPRTAEEKMLKTRAKGTFIWYELSTNDGKAAEKFYGSVLGWKFKDMSGPNGAYTIVSDGSADVGGIWTMPSEMAKAGAPVAWFPYVGVDDVDGFTKRVKAAGGRIQREPEDIPGYGRFSMVTDPQGAYFMLMTPTSTEARPTVAPETPGQVGWRELHAGEGAAAFQFYSEFFGWAKGDAMDMGPMGVYQTFFVDDAPTGGMMTKMPQSKTPFWLFYFNVPALDAAIAKVKAGGGTLVNDPMQVPMGRWIVQCTDPQGAMFALIAPKR
jgi:predicted enzyme related to lactoylglutathione lyase/AcrR family transcriptional regulator